MRHHLLRLSTLLCLPLLLRAQAPDAAALKTPLLGEFVITPGIVTGGRWVPPASGIYLATAWVGFQQERGYRLGLMATSASIERPLPTDPAFGMVRERYVATLTLERVRLRQRGPWIFTTAFGGGLGSFGYTVDQSRGVEAAVDVHAWVPAVTASADVALRVPASSRLFESAPIDFLVGVRSSALLGVRKVNDIVPSSGPIETWRGIAQVHQLTVGLRFGLLSYLFR